MGSKPTEKNRKESNMGDVPTKKWIETGLILLIIAIFMVNYVWALYVLGMFNG